VKTLTSLLARGGGDEPRDEALAAEIRAELEHHLACARAELERAGLPPAAAAAEAERRFGARARIEAECLGIQKGARLMGRRWHAFLTVALLLAVLLLAWTLQRSRAALELARAATMQAEEAREQALQASRVHGAWEDAPEVRQALLAAMTRARAALQERIRHLEALRPQPVETER